MNEKTYTEKDIKDAYEDGYYEGTGGDAWYRDHKGENEYKLDKESLCYKLIGEYVTELNKTKG